MAIDCLPLGFTMVIMFMSFVSAPPKVCIPEVVRVLKCVSAQLLFSEFPQIKEQLWGGHLWSDGYAVRTAGVVTSEKIEQYINRV
jgi:putative transposase